MQISNKTYDNFLNSRILTLPLRWSKNPIFTVWRDKRFDKALIPKILRKNIFYQRDCLRIKFRTTLHADKAVFSQTLPNFITYFIQKIFLRFLDNGLRMHCQIINKCVMVFLIFEILISVINHNRNARLTKWILAYPWKKFLWCVNNIAVNFDQKNRFGPVLQKTMKNAAITASYIRAEYAGEAGRALDVLLAEPPPIAIANFAPHISALEEILTANL